MTYRYRSFCSGRIGPIPSRYRVPISVDFWNTAGLPAQYRAERDEDLLRSSNDDDFDDEFEQSEADKSALIESGSEEDSDAVRTVSYLV